MNEIGNQVLDVAMEDDDSGATSIRGYFVALAEAVWRREADFSGKRPFGKSGWTWDVYKALADAGMITATFDQDGYIEDADQAKADELISAALRALASQQAGEAM